MSLPRGPYKAAPAPAGLGDTGPGWWRAAATCSSDGRVSSKSSSAPSTRRGPGTVRPCWSPAKPASARPGSRPSSRGVPATLGSTSSSVARSISSARSCPYQPLVEALRPLGDPRHVECREAGLAAEGVRGHARPAHGARAASLQCCSCSRICTGPMPRRWISSCSSPTISTDRRVLLLATYRADEPASADRMHRLAEGVRRSGSAVRGRARAAGARGDGGSARRSRRIVPCQPALTDAIVARSEGNPFFAEELIAAVGDPNSALPAGLRESAAASACRGSTVRRRACCAWPRPPDATSGTRCSARLLNGPSTTCVSHCVRRSSAASSWPIRPAARSASATRSWPRRSTRRSSQASARSCTRRLADELARSEMATPAELGAALGGRRSNDRSARRLGRSGTPGRGRLRPRRGPRAPRAGARAVGRPYRTHAELAEGSISLSSARGQPELASQTGAATRAVELGTAGDRARRRPKTRIRAALLHGSPR